MISTEALEEYKKIYKEKFGKDISDKDAMEQATSLLTLMNAIYRPIKVKDYKTFQRRRLETGEITEKEFKELIKNVKCQKSKRITKR